MMLEGKVAIVTGAGGGIGREIAIAMALAGAAVVVNDIGASLTGEGLSETPGEQTRQIIEQRGGRAVTSRDSVAGWASAQRIVQAGMDAFGRVETPVARDGSGAGRGSGQYRYRDPASLDELESTAYVTLTDLSDPDRSELFRANEW